MSDDICMYELIEELKAENKELKLQVMFLSGLLADAEHWRDRYFAEVW